MTFTSNFPQPPLPQAVTTGALSLFLTKNSSNTQSVAMTAAGLSVVMPAANTFNAIGQIYLIRNSGSINFDLQDNTGATIFAGLAPNKSVVMWLRDNSTIAGQWSNMSNQAVQSNPASGLPSIFLSSGTNSTSICSLNSTQALVAVASTATVVAYVLTLTGNIITVGGANYLTNVGTSLASPYAIACCQGGLNQAIVVTGESRVIAVTVTGTGAGASLTQGGANGFSSVPFAAPSAAVSVAPAGTGQVIVTYQDINTNAISACVVTYDSANNVNVAGQANSGSSFSTQGSISLSNIGTDTILVTYLDVVNNSVYGYILTGSAGIYTKGTTYFLTTAANIFIQSCYIGSNQAILSFGDPANSNYISATVISISGTVLSINAIAQIFASTYTPASIVQTSTGNALVLLNGSNNLYALSVSGTTITVGTAVSATGVVSGLGNAILCQSNTNKAILMYWNSTTDIFARVVSVSGTTITYNTAVQVTAGSVTTSPNFSACKTNTDQVVCGYYDSSGIIYGIAISSAAALAAIGTNISLIAANVSFAVAPTATSLAFAFYYDGSTNNSGMRGCTVTSLGVITAGATTTANWPEAKPAQGANFGAVGCFSSSGKVIFAPVDYTYSTNFYTFLAQVSGVTVTNPTIGYSVAAGNSSGTNINITSAAYDTNRAILGYTLSTSVANACIATATGYTLAFGTALLVSNTVPGLNIVQFSPTTWIYSASQGTSGYVSGVLSASGTTITAGNRLVLNAISVSQIKNTSVALFSSTQYIVFYSLAASMPYQIVNISGTTSSLSGSAVLFNSSTIAERSLSATNINGTPVSVYVESTGSTPGKAIALQIVKE